MPQSPDSSRPAALAASRIPPEARRSLDDVFSLVYEELRRVASRMRRGEAKATISSTALVHEAWLKLKDSPGLAATSVPHFNAIAAQAMRQILVEQARRRGARKRGGSGEVVFVELGEVAQPLASCDADLLDLDTALTELTQLSPRQAQIVEYRFFGGMNVVETAAILNVSESVVERDWRASKAWLATKLRPVE